MASAESPGAGHGWQLFQRMLHSKAEQQIMQDIDVFQVKKNKWISEVHFLLSSINT